MVSHSVKKISVLITLITDKPNKFGLQNTPIASLQRGNTPPPANVLYMTSNILIVRL